MILKTAALPTTGLTGAAELVPVATRIAASKAFCENVIIKSSSRAKKKPFAEFLLMCLIHTQEALGKHRISAVYSSFKCMPVSNRHNVYRPFKSKCGVSWPRNCMSKNHYGVTHETELCNEITPLLHVKTASPI